MTTIKDDRHYTRTTTQETKWLDDLRVRHNFVSRSEVIRYCIQQTIEDESDAIGSRRHFSRTMNQKLDLVIEQQRISAAVNLLAITEMMTNLINLLEEDTGTEPLDAGQTRIELYKKSITKELIMVVNSLETIQRQQRPMLKKFKKENEKQQSQSDDIK